MTRFPSLAVRGMRLVTAWHHSRQERTPLPQGERVASVEAAIGGSMRPGRAAEWLPLDRDEPESEREGVEPDADEPEIDEPDVDEPDVDEPEIDEPDVDEPDVDEPEVDDR